MKLTLTGPNSFSLHRRLEDIVGEFSQQHGQLGVERIDASEAEPQPIMDAAGSLPFLTGRKLVIIRDLSQNKAAAEQVEQIISSTPETVDLVFYEPVIDRRTAIFKVLKKQTQLDEYRELEAAELAKWLVGEAQKQAARLSFADANYLVERVGQNQSLLFNELNKLITFSPSVSRANIDLLSEKTPQSRVFDLLDQAFGGNKIKALELYQEQRAQKVEPQAILAMITWQLGLIALAKAGRGKAAGQIAQDAGISPFPISKAQKLAANLSVARIKKLIKDAYNIDRMAKTKAIEPDEALKTYITTL